MANGSAGSKKHVHSHVIKITNKVLVEEDFPITVTYLFVDGHTITHILTWANQKIFQDIPETDHAPTATVNDRELILDDPTGAKDVTLVSGKVLKAKYESSIFPQPTHVTLWVQINP